MELLDSRRLTGPNILSDKPGAVIDVRLEPGEVDPFESAWRTAAMDMLAAVGWKANTLHVRRMANGVSLGFDAPIDALYAATEINDWAFETARREVAGEPALSFTEDAARLVKLIEEEINPDLIRLRDTAREHDLPFLSDDDQASIGFGCFSKSWAVTSLPTPQEVPWGDLGKIPVGLITGTNGKTTTVRLVAAMIAAAGKVVGLSSTDRVVVGNETIDKGDYAGPGGAREVLRHPGVEIAALETARGGLLRRGVAMQRADAAVITNIAADHLDDFGVSDLEALADVKWLVTRVLGDSGTAVLNAEDTRLVERSATLRCPVTWFALDAGSASHAAGDRPLRAFVMDDGDITLLDGDRRRSLIPVTDVPITLDGSARHNIANCLAAMGLADALGVAVEAMLEALRKTTHAANPGRGNLFDIDGTKVLVDFAHNPHGVAALRPVAEHYGRRRRVLLIGQAGDRGDEAIHQLADAAWQLRPDKIIIKEMGRYSRGRQEGEVARLLHWLFVEAGANPESISYQAEEIDGVKAAIDWAQPGDLAILLVHEDIAGVVEYVRTVSES
ncbi:MAG: Mur ligase [Gammaproteobacteria bacterium]|nr:MAG: Mur ligase [Gammaproteobacteria bacterium]